MTIESDAATGMKPALLKLINRFLNKHLTPKKIHEIDKLCETIQLIAERNCKLFDVGSGQGHLSRKLAFKYEFGNITSVDCNSNLLLKANQIDNQLLNDFKCLPSNRRPKQLNYTMNKENCSQLIRSELGEKESFGLIGLHSCGNLSHDLLEVHKNCESKYLFLCSCCYHKTKADR